MFLENNFGVFHWELFSLNFHISCEKTHRFQIPSLCSFSEEQCSEPAVHRTNVNVYSARRSAGTVIIKIKDGKVWEYNSNIANKK